MSPQAALTFRRVTALLAVIWAVAALVLALAGLIGARRGPWAPIATTGLGGVVMVQWIGPDARRAGVEPTDRVLEVDGEPINAWYRTRGWERIREGVPVRYVLAKRDGRRFEVELAPLTQSPFYQQLFLPLFGAALGVGFVYLALGCLVFRLKPEREESWAFLLFCSVIAMQLWSSQHTYDALWGFQRMHMNLPFVGATAFHLFCTFPRAPAWSLRRPGLRMLPYGVAAAVALSVLLQPLLGTGPDLIPYVSFGTAIVLTLLGVGVLMREWVQARRSGDAGPANLVFVGALLSFVPVLVAVVAQLLLRANVPVSVALLWFVAFPLAVAWGIVQRQLFDIRGAARSSAAHGAATLAITGVFALLITSADAAFSRFNVNARSPAFSVAFLFFAILAFNPLRNRLQSLVDRFFDRDRAGYRHAVREISEAMVSMLSLSEICDRLLAAVTGSMGVERAMVLLHEEERGALRPVAWRGDWEENHLALDVPADHPVGKQLWMRREELSRADFDESLDPEVREACRDVFDLLEAELLVPILFGVDLLGVIAVGRKASGERLGADDRQLLHTLANQSAIAIENAKAFDEIAQLNETLEARVEERTRELRDTQAQLMQSEKMRSLGQLVAGVAHELNNPIGFVHANLQLLEGYVERLIRAQASREPAERLQEAIGKLLSRSREGTERVKKIVQDLRTFSRMDQAELADADLNEEIERTLGLMEARFKDGIQVERDFAPLPLVRCFPAQLNQVFMNLTLNACDALGGRGRIVVRTRPTAGGVSLEFADDGPGIPPHVRERIFEPFFTTKPVGEGTGLGLSISHGIVERHGGQLQVECPADGGTVFRIELPRVATPREVA